MDIYTQRQTGAPAGYESASAEVEVDTPGYPSDAQVVWKDPASLDRKALRIVNTSATPVTAKLEKKITFADGEPGLEVESGGLTEFPIPANDEIVMNFELIFSELSIFLKAASAVTVKVYIAGRTS